MERPLRILFLCSYWEQGAATVRDHVRGLVQGSVHEYAVLDPIGRSPPPWLDLSCFDAVLLHYSVFTLDEAYLSRGWRRLLTQGDRPVSLFLQDEYRRIDRIHEVLRSLRVQRLFTCVPETEHEKVYPRSSLPDLRLTQVLTGYVPEELKDLPSPATSQRRCHVGYRARDGNWWLGDLYRQKWMLAEEFTRRAPAEKLEYDVSCREQDRIYGAAWLEFLRSCRATLGSESGANVFDFSGDIERQVRDHLSEHPAATYQEVHDRYLAAHDGKIRLNQVSPRVFEAAACRTAMIMIPGEYSGVLRAGLDYFPIEEDFSNFSEVAAFLRDAEAVAAMAESAYQRVIASGDYGYNLLAAVVDAAYLEDHGAGRRELSALPARSVMARGLGTVARLWPGGQDRAGLSLKERARRVYYAVRVHPELRRDESKLLRDGLPAAMGNGKFRVR